MIFYEIELYSMVHIRLLENAVQSFVYNKIKIVSVILGPLPELHSDITVFGLTFWENACQLESDNQFGLLLRNIYDFTASLVR